MMKLGLIKMTVLESVGLWRMVQFGPKLKTGKGAQFTIGHAGGEVGFVSGVLFMFRSRNGNNGDYRDSKNNECFRSSFQYQQYSPVGIPHHSLFVMDNAFYHSTLINKAPTRSSKKCDVIKWIISNNIDHEPSHTKSEVLKLAASHKNKQVYEIDKIAYENGHKVVRLPPYHCHLNPNELVWAQFKSAVRKEIQIVIRF